MASEFRPGALVAWWRGNDLAFAVHAGVDKQRVSLVGPGGREDRVPAARLAFEIVPGGVPPGRDPLERKQAGERAEEAARLARDRAATLDVALLWELALEGGRIFADEEIADLAFGDDSGPARAAAVVALLADGLRFVRKPAGWEAREREAVEEILRQRERAAARSEERARSIAALASAMRGEPFVSSGGETERRFLRSLEEVAVLEEDAPESSAKAAADVIADLGVACDSPAEGAFRILRKVGRFASDDENLALLRYGVRLEFPAEVVAAARAAVESGFSREGREDLTGLEVVTVDGPRTREVDDALSFEGVSGGLARVGVHIADPAAFIATGSLVDAEALARAVSHYFPERRVPMIPSPISEDAASLVAGKERPALSFLIDVDESGAIAEFRVVRSIVRVRSRLDYDEADRAVAGEGPWRGLLGDLAAVASRREAWRAASGAVRILAGEAEVLVEPSGSIVLERRDTGGPGHRLVAEAMILAGEAAARYGLAAGIPTIYRRQAPPDETFPRVEGPLSDPVLVRRARRGLRRGEAGLRPGRHHALGLDAYVQATSPLRRYQDLVAHRQIASHLAGGAPAYDAESLQRIAATTERAEIDGRRAERQADRYWILRYLEEHAADVLEGIVVDLAPRPIVLLEETLVEAVVPGLAGATLGERVRVRIQRVNPRADRLALQPAALC